MGTRLQDKVAIVVGAGQTPGETIGNGRATAVLFAREGAKVVLVDRRLDSAEETRAMIEQEGGEAVPFEADITQAEDCRRFSEACLDRYGRIDVLHNNVGIGEGSAGFANLTEEAWERTMNVNLKTMFLTCKQVLPQMVCQGSGAIINISSAAAVASVSYIAYKTSKAGVNALTHGLALEVAEQGVRVNGIMPGMVNTPMAIKGQSAAFGVSEEELIRRRDEMVPLKGGMGDAWDIAYAALFLASDEAKFITGVILPVDGGRTARIG
jgi:NAD(P)-dependent dehydrogenase (short-subunit alcohol dehydrogenase family)